VSLTALLSGCGAGAGSNAKEALAPELKDVPGWVRAEKLPAAAIPGAELFATVGCTTCHTYLDSGVTSLGAPDLTAIGAKKRGVDYQIRYLEDPAAVTEGSQMPRFAHLGDAKLRQLAVFLEASRGER
jgi:mono/diheme cytochrome c family protein